MLVGSFAGKNTWNLRYLPTKSCFVWLPKKLISVLRLRRQKQNKLLGINATLGYMNEIYVGVVVISKGCKLHKMCVCVLSPWQSIFNTQLGSAVQCSAMCVRRRMNNCPTRTDILLLVCTLILRLSGGSISGPISSTLTSSVASNKTRRYCELVNSSHGCCSATKQFCAEFTSIRSSYLSNSRITPTSCVSITLKIAQNRNITMTPVNRNA